MYADMVITEAQKLIPEKYRGIGTTLRFLSESTLIAVNPELPPIQFKHGDKAWTGIPKRIRHADGSYTDTVREL